MRQRARTPEELEDALVIRDHEAVAELFEDGAVLGDGPARSRTASRSAIAVAGCCSSWSPSGIEDVIRATSEPAQTRTLPPPPAEEPTPEEIDDLKAIVKDHGYELLV